MTMTTPLRALRTAVVLLALTAVAACNGGRSGSPPSALTYTPATATFTVGTAIAPLIPTVTGTVDTYGVAPALPAGLSINATSGQISGTPAAVTATTSYTVTATNARGSTTATLSLAVNVAAPSALSYPSPRSYVAGTAIAALTPTVTGTVASWSVAPVLPAGLALDTTTGVITGTPTVPTAAAAYTVTARNVSGTATFAVNVTVTAPVPLGLNLALLAGSSGGSSGYVDAVGAAARFNNPRGVAVDGSGNVYVADTVNSLVRKIATDGTVTTLAGNRGVFTSVNGTGSGASFSGIGGIAVDAGGTVYVTDSLNDTVAAIRKITPAGVVTTLAGSLVATGLVDGPGATARFRNAYGLTIGAAGILYVTDYGNTAVRQVLPDGTTSTVVTAANYAGNALDLGRWTAIARDASGNLYLGDEGKNVIWKVAGNVIARFTGQPSNVGGSVDGAANVATFDSPSSMTFESTTTLLVADFNSHVIRRVSLLDGAVTTVMGAAYQPGVTFGTSPRLNFTGGIAMTPDGRVAITSMSSHNVGLATIP